MFGKSPKRGAVQRPAPSQQPQKLIPNWLWMLFGTLVGLSIAVLLFLWQPWRPAERATPTEIANLPEQTETTENKADYQFYDLLPKQQVTPVPDQEVPLNNSRDAQPLPLPIDDSPVDDMPVDSVLAAQNKATPDPFEVTAEVARAPQYVLQINSFQNPDEADRQRAEVLLVGLSADVRQHVDSVGVRWYRVVSGPYVSRDEAQQAHRLLQDSGIAALVVEQR